MAGGLVALGAIGGRDSGGVWTALQFYTTDTWGMAFGVEQQLFFPTRVAEKSSKRQFDVTTLAFGMDICAQRSFSQVRILGCAVGDIGFFIAGTGLSQQGIPTGAMVLLGPRLAIQLPLSDIHQQHFGFRVFADLRFSQAPGQVSLGRVANKDNFEFDNNNTVVGLFGAAITWP